MTDYSRWMRLSSRSFNVNAVWPRRDAPAAKLGNVPCILAPPIDSVHRSSAVRRERLPSVAIAVVPGAADC